MSQHVFKRILELLLVVCVADSIGLVMHETMAAIVDEYPCPQPIVSVCFALFFDLLNQQGKPTVVQIDVLSNVRLLDSEN